MSQTAIPKIFLPDYLRARGTATVLTHLECTVFGIPYPLEQGWIRKYNALEITPRMLAALWKSIEGKESGPVNRTRAALMTLRATLAKPDHQAPRNPTPLEDADVSGLIRLNVPYAEKDEVKQLGARWNPRGRFWYVPEGRLLTSFEQWLPAGGQHLGSPSSAQSDKGAPQAAKQQKTADLFGSTDFIIGKTIIGPDYFDTGHDCIPWLPCEQCSAAVQLHADRKKQLT